MSEKHRWTIVEDEYCCKRYVEEYVIRKGNMDMSSFARLLSKELPEIKESSFMHFTALNGRNSVLERPLYGAKRPHCNY